MIFSLSKKKVIVRPVRLPQFDYAGVEKIQDPQKCMLLLLNVYLLQQL